MPTILLEDANVYNIYQWPHLFWCNKQMSKQTTDSKQGLQDRVTQMGFNFSPEKKKKSTKHEKQWFWTH